MLNLFQNLFSKRKPGIGIELAPERVNIVELQKKGQSLKLVNLASAEVPENVMQEGRIIDSPIMAEIIQSLLTDNKIKAKNVATCIPSREAVIRLIPVPSELNDDELRDYMNAEAGLYLPFPRDDADVDYQKLNPFTDEDGIEKVNVVMVATRQEITQTYIDTFEQAGLTIDVIEVSSFSLLRAMRDQLQQFADKEAAVIADIEFDSTELVIVVNGVPQFNRTIPIGTYQIQAALNEAMKLPPTRDVSELLGMTVPIADTMGTSLGATNPGVGAMLKILAELTDELRRSIDFYMNQSDDLEMSQLLLAGPGAGIGQLDEYFLQRLSLPTSSIDPVESLGLELLEDIPREQRVGLGIALGLGIRETK